jgi:hypothetical protein
VWRTLGRPWAALGGQERWRERTARALRERGTGLTHPPTRRAPPSVSLPPRTPRQLTPLLIRHTLETPTPTPFRPTRHSIHWIPAKHCPGCGSAQVCVGLMRRGGPKAFKAESRAGWVAERIQASPHDTQLSFASFYFLATNVHSSGSRRNMSPDEEDERRPPI